MPSLRVPVSWLREHVDVPAGVDELAERLHMSGTEVEGVERAGGGWGRIWVGRIVALEKHPNAERLWLATVDYGEGRTKTVVTGAANLAVGAVVPYAELGARLREGHGDGTFALEARKVRGIQSEGMVCSARELGVGDDHEGILLLDGGLPVGARLADVLGETVVLIEVQPNRPDVLSIVGVAREVAALYDVPLREPATAALTYVERADGLDVRIEDPRACPRFAAALLEDVRGGPAPSWMQERLRAAGMRPIDLVVDVTNYVMLELGQPLHAYDVEQVRGRTLVARPARPGERLRTLDGVERQLDPSTLVIADAERALGLAGILGGEESEIRPGTRSIALECASFEPLGIRRTTARYGLHGSSGSAAARRFGLDLSPALVPVAIARAAALLAEHAGARVAAAIDRYPRPRAVPTVRLRFADFERKLGVAIPRDDVVDALRRLRFEVGTEDGTLAATPPAVRTDIAIREDVVEEVARIVGYERIPTRVPSGPLPPFQPHPFEELRERVRDLLAGFGLQEIVSYSLIDPAWLERLTPDGACIAPQPMRVTNPTTVAQSVLRPTLRASLLDAASRNLRHRPGVALFEISPAYLPRGRDLPEERWIAGVVLSGDAEPVVPGETWLVRERRYDIHDLRAVLDGLARGLHLREAGEQRHGAAGLHPARSATVGDAARPLLVYGQLDPRVAEEWELPHETLIAEVDVAALLDLVAPVEASVPPRYPPALRDISITVDEGVAYADVEREARGAAKGVLEAVALVDLYRGAQAGAGRKSFTLRLTFRSQAGTLSDAEIERAMRRIEGRLAHSLGAAVRA